MTTVVRSGVLAVVLLSVAACSPKGPAPLQCTSDANCFAGGVCNAGGTCVTGANVPLSQMPKPPDAPLDADSISKIDTWIMMGAPNN